MPDEPSNEQAFEALAQEARVARTARMLTETDRLQPNQRADIAERFARFIEEYGFTQAAVARELGWSTSTMSDVVRLTYKGDSIDRRLVGIHNWMELAARRENMLRKRRFVEHSVAIEILQVAGIVAETCKMGVVFGPAQIGKSMTLEAIQGDARYGDPVLIRVDESMLRPFPLCRAIAVRFELSDSGTFDKVFRRIVARLVGTKRMLMFDEAERVTYKALECIRDLHDSTGCPVLLCGKPAVYEKLGFRHVGDFAEVTDQLASRIIVRRDLTERTRGGRTPKPLFSLDDIRKLIGAADLKLHVAPDAVKWLQSRASSLGTGGIGNALACFYLACKLAFVEGAETITVESLDRVADLTMGHEHAQRVSEVVAEASALRRVV
ncbi:MAG: AAA family ATPase [Planctomycetes bacterium]|nr:AAA family ATPase [Planctomycetota bacterium]